jgi:zinc D-Ala-D-Ala carboxypeptidase
MNFSRYNPEITEAEITCRCGCGSSYIKESFLKRLYRARMVAGIPFNYNSICRCPKHNKIEGGSDTSSHISTPEHECCAADIRIQDNRELFIIVRSLMFAGFTRIGIDYDETYIHVDEDETKDQQVLWIY